MAFLQLGLPSNNQAIEWLISEYGLIEQRRNLLDKYNNRIGPPSPAMRQAQMDFINTQMEPTELVVFVVMCQSLVDYVN